MSILNRFANFLQIFGKALYVPDRKPEVEHRLFHLEHRVNDLHLKTLAGDPVDDSCPARGASRSPAAPGYINISVSLTTADLEPIFTSLAKAKAEVTSTSDIEP